MAATLLPAGDPDTIAGNLAERFRSLHRNDPVGVFAAPGRVNLIGEHVDYNGGRCLPFALPHATYAAVAPRSDDEITVRSLQRKRPWHGRRDACGPGQVSEWPAYVAGVVWALDELGWDLPGLDIVVDSRVPTGAGLSSSAALECSVALGLCAVAGVEPDDAVRRTLREACMRAETEVAGAPTGGMDQSVALFAQEGHALLLDFVAETETPVRWSPEDDDLTLLIIDTRAHHTLSDGGYGSRRADCETAAQALAVGTLAEVTDRAAALDALDDERVRRRARHVFSELDRVDAAVDLLRAGDHAGLGPLLTGSHVSLRDDFEVSCPELDVVVDTALAHGALGARMTGGGFGGSAIALVPAPARDEVAAQVQAAFAERDWAEPGFLVAPAARGAHRVR